MVRHLLADHEDQIVNIDCLTYAGNVATVENEMNYDWYHFEVADIIDQAAMNELFE